MDGQTDLDLLLIGKTGNGKSATGNSILRRQAFECDFSTNSVTTDVDFEVSQVQGRTVKVVDTPGLFDTRLDETRALIILIKAMKYAIAANPRGYHAFLLVVKFGGRFTGEEQDAVYFLKKIFGESFVRDFCIIVMTAGDMFCKKETGDYFLSWCSRQTGPFKELLAECENRIVLFDNTEEAEADVKDEQLTKLLNMVDRLRSRGKRYTDENFQLAAEARKRVIIESKEPVIREETLRETSLILQKLETIQNSPDDRRQVSQLENLLVRTEALLDSISHLDQGTGVLHELVQNVKAIHKNVANEVRVTIRLRKEREVFDAHVDSLLQDTMQEMQKQREKYERILLDVKVAGRRQEILAQQRGEQQALEARNRKTKQDMEREFFKEHQAEQQAKKEGAAKLENTYRKIRSKAAKDSISRTASFFPLNFLVADGDS